MILVEQGGVRRQVCFQERAGRLVRKTAPHDAVTGEHTARVLVDDEYRTARRVEQDDVSRLGPYPRNPQQIPPQGSEGQTSHLLKATIEPFEQPCRERAQAPGLEAIGSSHPQCLPEVVLADSGQPRRAQQAPGTQLADGALCVTPGGELRQDGASGDLVSGPRRPPALRAEPALQSHVQAQQARLHGVSRRARDPSPVRERSAP